MIIFKNILGFKNHLRKLKNDNITIGFVPTMGALHDGHTSLIKKSVLENDYSVVSIFINPTQFNNINDYESYPINISKDIELLDSISENIILFSPDTDEIYSGKVVSDSYDFGDLDKYMEGEHRKGHFQGVATVVHKLFEIVTADNVYFGEKDFQQLRIIEDIVKKNRYKLNVIRCKTIRQNDGLALSSRNKKLDIYSQNIATNLFKALSFAKKNFDTLDNVKANSTIPAPPWCSPVGYLGFCYEDLRYQNRENIKGNELAKSPELTASASLQYQTNLSSGNSLFGSIYYVHRGEFQQRVINHPMIDAVDDYNVVNLTAGIDFANGAWGFDLMIFNATDEDGINSAMTDVFGVNATGLEFIPPRQIMGRVSYTF